ncbi:hypothetical protein ABZ722_34875, partial [Streptomyces longwoodensis]|uniref:hypothetical protein n=1 Tax=Streptomyces longwoodensis TaxID=68231 RepID=UPI0033D00692
NGSIHFGSSAEITPPMPSQRTNRPAGYGTTSRGKRLFGISLCFAMVMFVMVMFCISGRIVTDGWLEPPTMAAMSETRPPSPELGRIGTRRDLPPHIWHDT